MDKGVNCPACGLQSGPDSIFCRRCGQRLVDATSSEEKQVQELLAQSAQWNNLEQALDACGEYLSRFPEGSAALDFQITRELLVTYITLIETIYSDGPLQFPKQRGTSHILAHEIDTISGGIPSILKNGIVTVARIMDEGKRTEALKIFKGFQDWAAKLIQPLFEEAQRETESLMVDGETRAKVEGKTMEEAYDDAEVYYRVYKEGDLDGALRGFSHLKSLNPMDAYFRNMLGSVYFQQERLREALMEYLYAVYLDPGEPHVTANLMRTLTALRLFPAAMEVWNHYCRYSRAELSQSAHQEVGIFGRMARIIMAGLVCQLAGVNAKGFSPRVSDLLDEVESHGSPLA